MPQFMLIYKGEATDLSDMTPEQGAEVMAKWGAWMEDVGSALTDVGSPFGAGMSVLDNGDEGIPGALTGYSIVEATDIAAAKDLTGGHPYLSDDEGLFAIDIYELLPVPFED